MNSVFFWLGVELVGGIFIAVTFICDCIVLHKIKKAKKDSNDVSVNQK